MARLLEDLTRMVGVNVELDDLLVLNENHAVADRLDQLVKRVCLVIAVELLTLLDYALGAVGEGDAFGIKAFKVCFFVREVKSFKQKGELLQKG